MPRCTAPTRGHRTASGRANCPACGGRSRGYSSYYPSYSNYSSPTPTFQSRRPIGTRGGTSRTPKTSKPRWSSAASPVYYSTSEVRALTPIRAEYEKRAQISDLRDVFLCHAWDDRRTIATKLSDKLVANGVSVWFSEKDIPLGAPFMRQIDKGLANSKIGIVLVTPAFLKSIKNEGVADKELSALLARDRLIPIAHNATFDELREVSPLLGSRNGLSTEEDTMNEVVLKLAELVKI